MVFDHPEARLPQKARENAKRRTAHHLATQRHAWELARFVRLQHLLACVDTYNTLTLQEKTITSQLLRQRLPRRPLHKDLVFSHKHSSPSNSQIESLVQYAMDPQTQFQDDIYEPYSPELFTCVDECEVIDKYADEDTMHPIKWHNAPSRLADAIQAIQQDYMSITQSFSDMRESTSQRPISLAEEHLYVMLTTGILGADTNLVTHNIDEWHMMCSQLEQSVRRLGSDDTHALNWFPAQMCVRDMVSQLCMLSDRLVGVYRRASRLVPKQAYLDLMDLCRLMHVPVLVTGDGSLGGGPMHEAEAMASSLVLHGYADMVASEDSDVLLYQVPLLRGLSNMTLELVDSQQVCQQLFPSATSPFALFMEFALLCGTDFNRTVPGIAAVSAHRWISYVCNRPNPSLPPSPISCLCTNHASIHASVEAVLRAQHERYAPPDQLGLDTYLAELSEARAIFLHPPSVAQAADLAGLTTATATTSNNKTNNARVTAEPAWAAFLRKCAHVSSNSVPTYDPIKLARFLRAHKVWFTESVREACAVHDTDVPASERVPQNWATMTPA